MGEKLAIGGRIALPAVLGVAGGYALGYVHGYQDALGMVWNLRGVAQCLDASASASEDSEEDIVSWGRWVWKVGERKGEAGQPLDTHNTLESLLEDTPSGRCG